MANKKKYIGGNGNGRGGKVIVAYFRHYITGKRVFPKKAKAIAFTPRVKKAS